MQIPLAFADPVAIEEVSLPLWRELFDTVGWPETLSGKSEPLTHGDITASFLNDSLSDELSQAIEAIQELGTPEGREAISTMMADRKITCSKIPQGLGERELALRLFLVQRTDGALAEVFSRAQVQIQEGNHRRFNDFIGKKPKHINNLKVKCAALEQAIREYCIKEDLGDHVQLRDFDDDGTYRFQIMRSHHTRTPLAVMEGTPSRAKIQYRPVHADLVRYEPTLGRLRITARATSIVECYRKIFGRILFEDETFFYGPPVCNLQILQEDGRGALANHNVFGVGRVWMTECTWERGDSERLNLHATDCFDSIEELKVPISEGEILQAKLKIELIGKSTRPVIVTIRAPSRIEVSQVRHEGLVNEVLEAIGIRDEHERVSEYDLWTLYPWRQSISAWRNCFGADTDSLAAKSILKKTILDSIGSSSHSGAGRVYQAERLSSTEFLGVSSAPEIPSKSLSITDLDGLELVVPLFQNYLREVFDITNTAVPWSTNDWFVDLGVLDIYGHQFRLFYAMRQPSSDAAGDLRKISNSIQPVLLLPKGIKDSTGVTEITLDKALPNSQRVKRDIVAAFELTRHVPAIVTAPDRARLVVDTQLGKIWFDGIEITELASSTHPFRFITILAKEAPAIVNKYDLAKLLSASSTDPDQTARSAKAAANKLIKAAVEAKGLIFEDPFKAENGSYRLAVPAYIPDFSSQSESEHIQADDNPLSKISV